MEMRRLRNIPSIIRVISHWSFVRIKEVKIEKVLIPKKYTAGEKRGKTLSVRGSFFLLCERALQL
jgi:hypothetical protein